MKQEQITEEQVAVAKMLGLDGLPGARYEDTPKSSDDGVSVNLMKACAIVDPLATAAFALYIPDDLEVDQTLDARIFKREWSWGIAIPTDIPVPTSRKIALSLRIPTNCRDESAFFPALAARMGQIATELGVKRLAPPLVWRSDGEPGVSRPSIGLVLKFDRTPPYGKTEADMMADVGILPSIS